VRDMADHLHIADITVGALMTRPALSVRPDTTVAALAALMAAHPFNGFPVVDDMGVLQGIVTRLDLLKRHVRPYGRFIAALDEGWVDTVAAIMSRHPITLTPMEPAAKAVQLFVDHRLRLIPVVEESGTGPRLVGVLSRQDVTRALLE
jgi:CBS domain-containing protein